MKTFFCLLAAFLVWLPGAHAQTSGAFAERPLTREQFKKLDDGGFVIYMRHGKTDATRPDLPELRFDDCNTQRPLSDEGRKMAADIGKSIRQARIPIADIHVSPMCRTRESAQLVFGREARVTVVDELFSSTNQTSEQKKPIIEATRRLLSAPVPPGKNRFILAHAPNLADTMGYFPKMEGTVVIFVPLGDGFEYVGSIRPDMWPDVLR